MQLYGIDFTSAPRPRKPIVVAAARFDGDVLDVGSLERLASFDAFDAFLARPGPWVGGFDLPFGLPRAFTDALGWPADWAAIVARVAALPRDDLVAECRAYCDARPPGAKFAHRATDRPAGSSPSMKWVNPPVLMMYRAGVPRLLAAGVTLPALAAGDPRRVALEAYPGMLARRFSGRLSYKNDGPAGAAPARRVQRERILDGLAREAPLGFAVRVAPALRGACLDEGSGDSLDAVLCTVQAAWGWQRRDRRYGLPERVDPLEGWIVGAPADGPAR